MTRPYAMRSHPCPSRTSSGWAFSRVVPRVSLPVSASLAALLVRRRVRSTLDVGTGCGVLALMTARHSERVVGVDTNPRALNFARFNAALNDVHNVEFREGSLFDP